MPNVTDWIWGGTGSVALFLGALLLYVASRYATDALAGDGDNPGRRAIGNWIAIAVTAIVAQQLHRPDLAIAIIFATSVTCLSLVVGSVGWIAPESELPETRRAWIAVLPTAFVTFLIGFTGKLNWIYAVILLIEGVVLLFCWNRRPKPSSTPVEPVQVVHEVSGQATRDGSGALSLLLRPLNFALAVALAVMCAFLAMHGLLRVASDHPTALGVAPIIVVALLGPLLILPMLSEGPKMAQQKHGGIALAISVGVALLNLCFLLPLIILLGGVQLKFGVPVGSMVQLARGIPPIQFPPSVWRIDNAILVVLGFALVPLSRGRWRLGRAEGVVLLGVYVAYVLMAIIAYRPA